MRLTGKLDFKSIKGLFVVGAFVLFVPVLFSLNRSEIASMMGNLYSRGIVNTLPRGSSDTLSVINRFEYAREIQYIVEKIENGEIRVNDLTKSEIENIEALVEEFSDEIVQLLSKKQVFASQATVQPTNTNYAGYETPVLLNKTQEDIFYEEEGEAFTIKNSIAQKWNRRAGVYLGASLYGAKSLGRYKNGSVTRDEKYTSSDLGPALGVKYGLSDRWVVDLRSEWYTDSVLVNDGQSNERYVGDLVKNNDTYIKAMDLKYKIQPISLTFSYFLETIKKFRPYIGLGGSIYKTTIESDEYILSDRGTDNYALGFSVNDSISCFVLQGGAEYWLDNRFFVKGELRLVDGDHTFNLAKDASLRVGTILGQTADEVRTALDNAVLADALSDDLRIDMSDISFHGSLNYLFD